MIEEMAEWTNRPLDGVDAAIFIDAIMVKVRDGQVANRPIYAAIGVSLAGEKDVLGLWAGTGGEGAKFWLSVLTDLKNRGVADVFFLVCDGLKGLPEVVGNVWPLTTVQTCIIHLIRNTFRLASKRDWDRLKRDVKLIYCAPNEPAARTGLDELTEAWGARYPDMIRLWENAWTENIGVPGLRPGDPHRDLLHERDRELERPLPEGRQGPRALPDRAGGDEVSLPGHPVPGPHREGPGTMDDEVEASPERVRHHLRRPLAGSRDLLMKTAGNTVPVTDPHTALLNESVYEFDSPLYGSTDIGVGATRLPGCRRDVRRHIFTRFSRILLNPQASTTATVTTATVPKLEGEVPIPYRPDHGARRRR